MDPGVNPDQSPAQAIVLLRAHDVQEEQEDDRANGIAVNIDHDPKYGQGLTHRQQEVQFILRDQAENQRADDQHDPSMLLLDIWIDPDCKIHTDQQKQYGKNSKDLRIMRMNDPIYSFMHLSITIRFSLNLARLIQYVPTFLSLSGKKILCRKAARPTSPLLYIFAGNSFEGMYLSSVQIGAFLESLPQKVLRASPTE